MNFKDFFVEPLREKVEIWQLGSLFSENLQKGGVALFFCSEERGIGREALPKDFRAVREVLGQLSKQDIALPICDLGDLITGKTIEDTRFILQEIIATCVKNSIVPIIIGGGNDLAYTLFKGLESQQSKINYTQINPFIQLENRGEQISENNFLAKILESKTSALNHYFHLGYQKHLNNLEAETLMKELGFDTLRLAEMMGEVENAEPFLRRADLVTLNCDVVESWGEPFSVNFQVNGLNRREICALMKEIGLGENLKVVGIFNYNFDVENQFNDQLLAQMIWYLLEGIYIQRSHPKQAEYETFIVMEGNNEYVFKREIFRDLWYFGEDEDIKKCIPCSEKDYENAKKGNLPTRLFR